MFRISLHKAGEVQTCSQVYSINRICQDSIDKRKTQIITLESKSTFAKKVVKTGAIALAIAGGVGIAYALFKKRSKSAQNAVEEIGQQAGAVAKVTKEQLKKEIEEIKNGQKIGSWAWWKSCLVNLALTPTILVPLFKAIGYAGESIAKKLFFADNAGSFIEQATQLGVLSLRTNEQGLVEKTLTKGLITKELEHSADLFEQDDDHVRC